MEMEMEMELSSNLGSGGFMRRDGDGIQGSSEMGLERRLEFAGGMEKKIKGES